MLKIFDLSKKKIGIFEGYDAFLGFITSVENRKLLDGSLSVGKGYWAFAEYSPEKLKHVCAWIKPGYLTTVQLKALEQNLGLLEICRGDAAAVWEVPVTSELDVEEIRKKFCVDYCLAHGWRLVETQDHKSSKSPFVGERRYVVHPYTRKSRLAQTNLDNTRGRRLKAELDCRIGRLRQQPVAEKFTSMPGPVKKIQEPTAREEEVNTKHASQGNPLAGQKLLAMQKENLGTKKYFMGALIGVGFGVLSAALGLEPGKSDPSNGNGQLPALIKVPKFGDGSGGIDSWVWVPDFPDINSEKLVKKAENLSTFQQLGESLINKELLRASLKALNNFLDEARQEHSMSPWCDARLSDGEPGVSAKGINQGTKDKPLARSKRPARVDWNKIMPQINGWIHAEPAEDGNRYLSRVAEEAKFFLSEFETVYDVHVVWEDTQNSFPDMTNELLSWVRQVQVMRHMAGTNAEALQNAMQQLKQKISGEF